MGRVGLGRLFYGAEEQDVCFWRSSCYSSLLFRYGASLYGAIYDASSYGPMGVVADGSRDD